MTKYFIVFVALAASAQTPRPLETADYLTGAWAFPLVTDAQRALYLKGGFNLVAHFPPNIEWGASQNMRFIGSVTRAGLPPEINPPFEAADGRKIGGLGFTQVNFQAPAVQEWWKKRVPEAVREMKETNRVAFWKVHNEFGYPPTTPFDYSEGNIAAYRRWLENRYRSIAALNSQWRTNFSSFRAIDPPRKDFMAQLANWLEFRRFTGWAFPDYFRSTGDLIRSVIPGAKASVNFYPSPPLQGWDHFQIAKQTDFVALDLYEVSKWPRLLEYMDLGRSAGRAYNKPFVMLEYHAGPNDWVPVVSWRDIVIEANTALARESRALMWYMWRPAPAGGEEGIHGLLDLEGKPTERYTAAAENSALTARLAPLLLQSQTISDVAILWTEDNGYLAYAQSKRISARKQPWSNLGHILNAARIQWDFIDTASVHDVNLAKYKAVIVAELPILSDEVLQRLSAYVRQGGVLITHPDIALRDHVGNERSQAPEFTAERRDGKLWKTRVRASGDAAEIVTKAEGRGKRISCAWEIPGAADTPDEAGKRAAAYVPEVLRKRGLAPDRIEERAAAYAALLASAGVAPVVTTSATPAGGQDPNSGFLDVRRLQAGKTAMVFLTWIDKRPLRSLSLTIPGVPAGSGVYLLQRSKGAVTRLAATRAGNGIRVTVPEIDPDAIVLAGGPWQPLVGLDAPKVMHPGDTFTAQVTVDNMDSQSVSGTAKLAVPAGWKASPKSPPGFSGLAAGRRISIAFDVTVPPGTPLDRFALDYPLTAEVEFTSGRSGKLSARHLPFVRPALDVILSYRDHILNPWQQLTPPVLRWGYNNEVRTPPPPPVPVLANGNAEIEIANSPSLAGQQVTLEVRGAGSGTVTSATPIVLTSQVQRVPIRFALSQSGEHQLVASAGGRTAQAVFQAGVDEETAKTALARQSADKLPPGWSVVRRIGVAAREAQANGFPVRVNVALPEEQARQAAVFRNGVQVAASISPTSVALAADVPKDGVSIFAVAAPGGAGATAAPEPASSMRVWNGGSDRTMVSGENYAIVFNRKLAQVDSIEVGGKRAFPSPSAWHMTTAEGPLRLAESGSFKITESPVEVTVELERPIGGAGLTVREKWALQARYASVLIGLRNTSKGPIPITGASYRLGLDPSVLSQWRPVNEQGVANVKLASWQDGQGRGAVVKLGRTVPVSWSGTGFSSPATLRHTADRSEIVVLEAARIDPLPGDVAFVEFEIWLHQDGAVEPRRPVVSVYEEAAKQ